MFFPWRSKRPIFSEEGDTKFSKNADYLQYFLFPPCAMNGSDTDSEVGKRFFRNFRNFLVPGMHVRKTRISEDKEQFSKFGDISKIPPFYKAP